MNNLPEPLNPPEAIQSLEETFVAKIVREAKDQRFLQRTRVFITKNKTYLEKIEKDFSVGLENALDSFYTGDPKFKLIIRLGDRSLEWWWQIFRYHENKEVPVESRLISKLMSRIDDQKKIILTFQTWLEKILGKFGIFTMECQTSDVSSINFSIQVSHKVFMYLMDS